MAAADSIYSLYLESKQKDLDPLFSHDYSIPQIIAWGQMLAIQNKEPILDNLNINLITNDQRQALQEILSITNKTKAINGVLSSENSKYNQSKLNQLPQEIWIHIPKAF